MKTKIAIILLLLVGITFGGCQKKPSKHSWKLNPQKSSIAIVTTKNNKITEVSEFENFSGTIKNNYIEISIDLNSLETNIPIRNERIAKHLFETNDYPTADIHTQLSDNDLTTGVHEIIFDVDLHGVSGLLTAQFMVTENNGDKIIALHKPLIIDASTFGLEQGIITLKNIAKLDSINFTVPVNLSLTFMPE